MNNSISITVFLNGQLEGCVKSVDKQPYSIELSKGNVLTRQILHTDRKQTSCIRMFNVSGNVVNGWVSDECPYWEKPSNWKKMSKEKKLWSYVKTFDEGFGVDFEEINDGGN